MVKHLEWEDHSAEYEDGDGDKHTHTVSAVVLDKDNYKTGNDGNGQAIPREFSVVGRSERVKATPGMVVVKTDKPDEYDIHSSDTWKDMGYSPVSKRGSSAKTADSK